MYEQYMYKYINMVVFQQDCIYKKQVADLRGHGM